jgi:hypothetical protein
MKRALILHGTDAQPMSGWRPWLKSVLEEQGYEVWIPALPGNHTPNRMVYNDYLFSQDWDFSDNIVVGHSSGAVSVLNLLMDARCPRINAGIMVSAWAGGIPTGFEPDNTQFDNLFPSDGFDFELIKSKASKLAFIHSDNDPYYPLEQAQYLAKELDAPLTVIHKGDHLGSPRTELPEILQMLNG